MAAQAQAVPAENPRRFIKLRDAKAQTTLSCSEIYRRIAADRFPRQVMLGPKSAVWLASEVDAWCEAQIAEREVSV
ncbi:helix-turn-helix transcriptional regulator [Stutzerimonas sp. NM35]